MHIHIAVDLGAESGRVLRGSFDGRSIRVEELRRFATGLVPVLGQKHWNLLRLYEEILQALTACRGTRIDSIGVDSWGVDFVLLDAHDDVIGLPYAYRSNRTDAMMEQVLRRIPAKTIHATTGAHFLPFNTLFQLFSLAQKKPAQLDAAQTFLMVPDYLHFLLTGRKSNEHTNASTTQCLNLRSGRWDLDLLKEVGIPTGMFQEIFPPGTPLGHLTPELQAVTGLPAVPVVAPATHDTASAVAAVPAAGANWAYICSGTWSLMGVETDRPVINDQSRELNFTNEGGAGGTFRLLKNVLGLWLVQQLRSELTPACEYGDVIRMAAQAPAFSSLIDPDDSRFLAPSSMVEAFQDYCTQTRQPLPRTVGEFVRCALDSLALQYRYVLGQLRQLRSVPIDRIHIVGGGSQNRLLCQLTADTCGVPIVAGPVEATALGNMIVQAQSLGYIASQADARMLIREACDLIEYRPQEQRGVEAAWQRFLQLKAK